MKRLSDRNIIDPNQIVVTLGVGCPKCGEWAKIQFNKKQLKDMLGDIKKEKKKRRKKG